MAALAGVSTVTASRVVNGVEPVAATTRRRVEAAIAEVGYRPDLTARRLARRRSAAGEGSDPVVLVIEGDDAASIPPGLLLGILDATISADVPVVMGRLTHRAGPRWLAERLDDWQADTVVQTAAIDREVDPPPTVVGCRHVLANCRDPAGTRVAVVADHVQGGRLATELLLARGHTRIRFASTECAVGRARLHGHRMALSAAGVSADPDLVSLHPASSPRLPAAQRLLAGATAVILSGTRPSGSDAVRVAGSGGTLAPEVPRDIVVVEVREPAHGAPDARRTRVVVEPPYTRIGRCAVQHALRPRTDGAPSGELVQLPYRVRASSRSQWWR